MSPSIHVERVPGGTRSLALITLVAWVVTAWLAHTMRGMPRTMGLGVAGFVAVWTLMMAAMMLPSVAPVALSYQRVIRTTRGIRLTFFVGSYLAVWACAGLLAFAVGHFGDVAVEGGHGAIVGATAFTLAGLYQLSPFKKRCLQHCRSPVSLLMRYSSYEGRLKDLAVGAHHGAYCLGCCWALFAVLVALGTMSWPVMIVLGAVVLLEKTWSHGVALARFVALGCIAAAVLLLVQPTSMPGLAPSGSREMESREMEM